MPYADPARRAAHNREWRQKNRFAVATSQRAKKLRREHGGALDTRTVRYILQEPCAYCGAPSEVIEHCTPLSRGGENEAWNVVGACTDCNDLKARKTVLEFFGLWPTPGLTSPPF
jgi:5-methylcytosine-specific restriction endonuclease McrA